MARILEAQPPGSERTTSYDWDRWFDGEIWLLEPGSDFPEGRNPKTVSTAVYTAAKRRGIKVRVGRTPEGAVWLRALRADVNTPTPAPE